MLTDLHLQKYLDGELTEEDEKDLEARLEKDPELRARLEALENRSQVLGQHAWQRFRKDRQSRRGSRTRYTTMLPALLFLILVVMVASHWFSRPGENSTFTMTGGNGNSLEILYDSPHGWRYLDKDFAAGDSLTFSVRDDAAYHVAVAAVFGKGEDAEVDFLWPDAADRIYDKAARKPVFPSSSPASQGIAPTHILVFYAEAPLSLNEERVKDLLASRGNERGGLDFKYQVFSAGR